MQCVRSLLRDSAPAGEAPGCLNIIKINNFHIFTLPNLNMQARKRHWGCDACDTLFNSVLELEEHKEEMEHWSDDEYESDGDDEEDDEEEECDCGCSSPPRILSSVGVGTEETVFTE